MATSRRLAAILAADVAGYSRLMGEDEEGTLASLKAIRRELGDPKVKEHRGRIVKTTGDGLLIEFSSVVDAVRCAVEVQRAMAQRNAVVPEEKRIEFRIGVNLGDIIRDGRDIFGDGVNIAARLEALAEPGGICVSRVVHDQVRDKLDLAFKDLGEQQVKNIARPLHVWRVKLGGKPAVPVSAPLDLPDKPTAQNVVTNVPDGSYKYDTLQLAFNKRFGTGLFIQASYDYQWRNELRGNNNFTNTNTISPSTSPLDSDPIRIGYYMDVNPAVGNRQKSTNWQD